MEINTIYSDSDNLLVLENLKDELAELRGNTPWVNNADVEVTVYESDGTTKVSGINWPVPMSHLSGSNGTYYLILDDAIEVSESDHVIIEIVVKKGANTKRVFELTAKVQ